MEKGAAEIRVGKGTSEIRDRKWLIRDKKLKRVYLRYIEKRYQR